MAFVNLNAPLRYNTRGYYQAGTGATLNAVGEHVFTIGQVFWKGGSSGQTKTISSAGGRIYGNAASGIVWANAATNGRLGIQDTTAGGINDGTFDVQADLVPGTEVLASNTLFNFAMESGSKTLSYGQKIAVGIEMTARGGADVISIDRATTGTASWPSAGMSSPYSVEGGAKTPGYCCWMLQFDDGTFGWVLGAALLFNTTISAITQIAFNQGSTPDEYVMALSFDVAIRIAAVDIWVGAVATTDTYDLRAYLDPFGTPSLIETLPYPDDPDFHAASNTGPFTSMLATPYDLPVGSVFGVSLRPTSVNNVNIGYHDLTSGFHILKAAQPFATIKLGARTDLTGAFAEVQTYFLPDFGIWISGLDASSAGGSFVF